MKILYFGHDKFYEKAISREFSDGLYNLSSIASIEELKAFTSEAKILVVDCDHLLESKIDFNKEINELEDNNQIISIPRIYVSNSDTIDQRLDAFQHGADDFVDKYDMKSLKLKIHSFLRPDKVWMDINAVLIEDDKISAKFITHVLKSKGANVIYFSSAVDAYEYVKNHPKIDLILTDHMMPILTGMALVKKIRKELHFKSIPIIFISSVVDKAEILEFYKSGGNDYLAKPLIKEELFVKVNQHIENRVKTTILKNQVTELENLNRVKDQFLAVCSHDLRTPLNTILGLSDLMINEMEDEEVVEYSTQIKKSANDLLELVNDLLDFSDIEVKKHSMSHGAININSLLKDSLNNIHSINTQNMKILFESTDHDIFIDGNKSMLLRAFNNILSNSYKFTGNNGEIKVKILDEEKMVQIVLSDTGIGIPEESIKKLLEKKYDVGRVGLQGEKSTGLGMKIVKEVADAHGAELKIISTEGVGTTISFKFNKVSIE